MNKTIAKTSIVAGVIAGVTTVLLLLTVYVALSARMFLEAIILMVGNVILFVPVGVIGGALTGLVLGTVGAMLGRSIKGVEVGERTGALYGGIIGGILIGLAPLGFGFGHL